MGASREDGSAKNYAPMPKAGKSPRGTRKASPTPGDGSVTRQISRQTGGREERSAAADADLMPIGGSISEHEYDS